MRRRRRWPPRILTDPATGHLSFRADDLARMHAHKSIADRQPCAISSSEDYARLQRRGRMGAWRFIVLAVVITDWCASSIAADDSKKPSPSREQIERWIRDLGSEDFDAREKASRRLWLAGKLAEGQLYQALKSEDLEVRRRARELVDKFKVGIYPDTPEKIVALIRQFQGASERGTRAEAVDGLLDEGSAGCTALARLGTGPDDPELRAFLLRMISTRAAPAFARAFEDKDFTALDELFEIGLTTPEPREIFDASVAYFHLRGRLEDKIAFFKKKLDAKDLDAAAKILTHLYRVNGNTELASKMAEKRDRKS